MNCRPSLLLASLLILVICCGSFSAEPETISTDDLSAWQDGSGDWFAAGGSALDPANDQKLKGTDGKGTLINGTTGRTKHLVSKLEHGDLQLHIEFMVPKKSNSGVYLQGRYEIQVLDSFGKENVVHGDCGGIYQRWDSSRKPSGYEGHPPRVNASRKPGEWQTFDITFQAPKFDAAGKKTANAKFVKVVHNGTVVHENVELTGPTRSAMFGDEKPLGPLMLQGDHGPVAYRNIRISKP